MAPPPLISSHSPSFWLREVILTEAADIVPSAATATLLSPEALLTTPRTESVATGMLMPCSALSVRAVPLMATDLT